MNGSDNHFTISKYWPSSAHVLERILLAHFGVTKRLFHICDGNKSPGKRNAGSSAPNSCHSVRRIFNKRAELITGDERGLKEFLKKVINSSGCD